MTIKLLKQNLLQAICEGYADHLLWFFDGDEMFTINKVYSHEEDGVKVCFLESNKTENKGFSALELLAENDGFEDELLVVVINTDSEKGYTIDEDLEIFDAKDEKHLWSIWDYGELYMTITEIKNEQ